MDSAGRKPLSFATITVFTARDTTLVNYRISQPEGDFKVTGLPLNKELRVVISFSGYTVYRKEFTLDGTQEALDLGTIGMIPNTTSLEEVLVIAERPPVVVRRDTIEFNAASFRTLPNALVEDLLKKLPGVQVDKEGNIMVNGKLVNRIQVDGKTFFGDDPKMATRNLPANVIDKIQVTDDKEELLRNGDDNLNNVGKVINITLKKGVKKGWFGKLYGGGGTDDRYEVGGIANVYRDTLQVSVLAYMNNLNRAGFSFSDLMSAGGFDRNRGSSAGTSMSVWNSSGGGGSISLNGINFGGSQGGGVATSKGVGFNLNHAPGLKRSFFLQYFYGNVSIDRRTYTDVSQFNQDTIIHNNTRLIGGTVTNAHNIGIGTRLKPDSLTNILLNANYTIGLSDERKNSLIASNNNYLGDLSTGNIGQFNGSNTYYYRHSASVTRLSGKKAGRRFTISHNLDMNNRYNEYNTETDLRFIYPNVYDSIAAQQRRERIPRTDASLAFNYSEPLTKKITLRLSARDELGVLKNNIGTYDQVSGQGHDSLIDALSSGFNRTSNRLLLSPGLEFKWRGLVITPSARLLMQHVRNELASLPDAIIQKQNDVLPSLNVQYKKLNLSWNQDIVLPSYVYLNPVPDNTNPYFITLGNAALAPARRNNIGVNYQFNDQRRNFNASVYGSGGITSNDVIQSITVDDKGVQTTRPVNADGSRNMYVNFNLYKQFRKSNPFNFSLNAGGNYNYNRNRLLYNGESTWQSTFYLNNWVGGSFNFSDRIEFNTSYSPGVNFTRYSSTVFRKLNVHYSWWDNELVVRWPKHIIWETQFNITGNSNLPAGFPKTVCRWNGAINFTMGKSEAAVLKLSVFDILDQNTSININATRNMVTSVQNNVVERYLMATFTYNVRPMGAKKKVGGRERFNFF